MLHNHLIPDQIAEEVPRVPFHTLQRGDKFKHEPNSNTCLIFKRENDFATVQRHDGWLINCPEGCFVWDKIVVKL